MMSLKLAYKGTGYAQVLHEQLAGPIAATPQTGIGLNRWWQFSHMCPAPTELSRPFTTAQESYRSCLHCGARQKFDAEQLKTTKSFYYPPTISQVSNTR